MVTSVCTCEATSCGLEHTVAPVGGGGSGDCSIGGCGGSGFFVGGVSVDRDYGRNYWKLLCQWLLFEQFNDIKK